MPAIITKQHPNVYPYFLAEEASPLKTRGLLDGVKENTTSSLKNVFSKNPNVAKSLTDKKWRVRESVPIIEHHLEKKVMCLFLQAIVCYLTNKVFEEGHTVHQGYNAASIEEVKFQAAHSATLPCLFTTSQGGQKIVYQYRSGSYDACNATIDAIKSINDADRAIEEKRRDSLLRKKAITFLNQASIGKLTPDEVVRNFVNALIEEVEKALKCEEDLEVVEVLQLYRQKAISLASYVENPENIDLWLNLDMKDPLLREVSLALSQENTQMSKPQLLILIKKYIEEIPLSILHERHQKLNECRLPNHFYDLFYKTVLNRFAEKELALIQEAVGTTQKELNIKTATSKRIKKTKKILSENDQKIDHVVQRIFALISNSAPKNQPIALPEQKLICLRPGVYKLRYKIIRLDDEVQSVIKSKLEDTFYTIKAQIKGRVTHLELFFYYVLFQRLSPPMQKMFSKLLNLSVFQLNRQIRELKVNERIYSELEKKAAEINQLSKLIHQTTLDPQKLTMDLETHLKKVVLNNARRRDYHMLFLKRLYEQTQSQAEKDLLQKLCSKTEEEIDKQIEKKLISKAKKDKSKDQKINDHGNLIDEAIKIATQKIHNLQTETNKFRGQLMSELRVSHGMKQQNFQAIYKKKNPGYPMSDGTLSNLENGIKEMKPEIIKQISDIFGVSETLFNPSHFAEI